MTVFADIRKENLKELCVNSDYIMLLIDRTYLLKYLLSYEIKKSISILV